MPFSHEALYLDNKPFNIWYLVYLKFVMCRRIIIWELGNDRRDNWLTNIYEIKFWLNIVNIPPTPELYLSLSLSVVTDLPPPPPPVIWLWFISVCLFVSRLTRLLTNLSGPTVVVVMFGNLWTPEMIIDRSTGSDKPHGMLWRQCNGSCRASVLSALMRYQGLRYSFKYYKYK